MAAYLLIGSIIIFACVIFNKVSDKLGIPMLLAFILLGMFFGSDGIVDIYFHNYDLTEKACSTALLFVMFYGGFGTNWREARPIAKKAVFLSSLGTIITATLVGLFCHYALHFPLMEGLLIGSVLSSTDAASVFSILKSRKLNLKHNTASLLELESGSNDPFAYMLTIIILTLTKGEMTGGQIAYMVFAQLFFGALAGVAMACFALVFLKRVNLPSAEIDTIFILSIAISAYAIPTMIGGNGYLSVYICGIILGNKKLENKTQTVHFFDALTGLAQMFLFFILGLLSFPSQFPKVFIPAVLIALFLTFIARPVAVFLILAPFKSKIPQQLLVSWSGLRGVASIVFAILAVINHTEAGMDVFNIVFLIVLFSILIQGSLLPFIAGKLNMTDSHVNVMKTFTDYTDEIPVQFIEFQMFKDHPWVGKSISEISLPPDSLLVLILRGEKRIIPDGTTKIHDNDILILSGKVADKSYGIKLYEKTIDENDEWTGKPLSQIPDDQFIITIRRGNETIIPNGYTVVLEGDSLIVADRPMQKSKPKS